MSTIPTSLTENQFDGHVLPYLSGRYTIRVFKTNTSSCKLKIPGPSTTAATMIAGPKPPKTPPLLSLISLPL